MAYHHAEALATLGAESIEFLLAHHYVRYTRDLSGGLIISRIVQRHDGIADEGLNCYTFDAIAKPKPYKDAILNFAAESFELNRAVFAELAAARAENLAA